MAHQYFNEALTSEQFAVGETVTIEGDEARHAVKVSRLRIGESITVSNGAGAWAVGEVTEANAELVLVKIFDSGYAPIHNPKITLVQALAKSGRDEQSVEQSTEYGIDGVISWQADRSIVRWNAEKRQKGIQKWARIAREAAKQSLRPHIPVCNRVVTTNDLIRITSKPSSYVYVLEPSASLKLSDELHALKKKIDDSAQVEIFFVVGPEGGISQQEVAKLTESGAKLVRLGETVLRTSSAGPAALAVANTVLQRW